MSRSTEHARASRAPEAVVVHGEEIRVDRVDTELPRVEARARFGGVDLLSVLAGTAAAIGSTVVLGALAGAVGQIGYEQGTGDQEITTLGLTAGLVVLALSLFLGGWVTGRVARYEGGRNGLLTGLVFVLLSAGLAAAASTTEAVRDLGLPAWLDGGLTLAAVGSLVTGLIIALGAALWGGRVGAGYHRRVDDALLSVRAGGLSSDPTPYPSEDPR